MTTEHTAFEQYALAAQRLLREAFDTQRDRIAQAAGVIAGRLMQGGMLYTFGTGHAHLLALEVFYRAGGLARVCPMLDERLMLHVSASGSTNVERQDGYAQTLLARYPVGERDVLICMSNSGRNAVPVELAWLARQRGAYVIALTSLRHSAAATPRNALGKRLYETADLTLDNCGVPGDAVVDCGQGFVGPTSTVVGAALLQGIVCEVERLTRAAGQRAEFFVSSNVDGGDAINARLIEKYKGLIPGL